MTDILLLVGLGLAFTVGLVLVPFGLPGLWLMVAALLAYAIVGGFERVGPATLAGVVILALIAEAAEYWLGFRISRRYGGSNRAGWGAILGGLAGAVVGTPLPLIGNVVGAFLGAFVGAMILQYSPDTDIRTTLGAGWGAVLGRAAGAGLKVAVGFAIAIIGLYAAWG